MPFKLNAITGKFDYYETGTASVTSAELSATSAALLSAINVVSNALSAAAPGAGFTEASAAILDDAVSAQAASIVSVLSAAVSQRASVLSVAAADALSVANAASVVAAEAATSAELASVDARITSVANATSNALSLQIYSVRDAEISNRNSAINAASNTLSLQILSVASVLSAALSQRASVLSQAISVADAKASNKASAVSAAVTSVKNEASNKASILSVAINVASAAATSADGHANTVSVKRVSADNVLCNAISNEVSVRQATSAALDKKISDLSAIYVSGIASVDAHANTVSAKRVSADNVLCNAISALEARVSSLSAAPPGEGSIISTDADVVALSNAISALEVRVSALSAAPAGVSVTSAELSAVSQAASANAVSIANVVSGTLEARLNSVISTTLSAQSTLLATVSARSGGESVKGLQSAFNAISYSLSVEKAKVSDLETRMGNVSNVASNALSVANAASVLASNAQSIANVVSNALCNEISLRAANSATLDAKISDLSARYVSGLGALSQNISVISNAVSALEVRVSANSGGAASVTSNELSTYNSNILSLISATQSADGSVISMKFVSINAKLATAATSAASALAAEAATSGELATTSAAIQSAAYKRTYTWIISAPAVGGVYGTQVAQTTKAVKVILATLSANTSFTANVEKRPTFGAAGSNILSADKEGSATPVSQAADSSAGAATITAGSWLYVDIAATSGTPAAGIVVLEVGAP